MSYALGPGHRRPSNQEAISLELVSGLLMIIAFLALAALFIGVITQDDIVRAVQGPEFEGLGLKDVRLVTPQERPDNQARFVVDDLDEDSSAAQAGLLEGDILLTVGGTAIDAATLTEDTLPDVLSSVFTAAAQAGQTTLPIEVYREGETLSFTLPMLNTNDGAIELELPIAGDTKPFGFELNFESAADISPYYALFPEENGPSHEIPQGAKLLAIDDTIITAAMPLEEVKALTLDRNVPKDQEDYVIVLDYEFVRETTGRLVTVEDRPISKEVPPTLTIALLDNFGIVIPVLVIGFALQMVVLGMRLRQYKIAAARWAQVAYMWLAIGLVVYGIKEFWVQGQGGSFVTDQPFSIGKGIKAFLPYLLLPIPLALAYRWLGGAMNIFKGEETLTQRNTRFAWTLLIPTLAMLIMVAARPLEQTFVKSLTDDTLASSSKPIQFVGLDNYRKLLDFRPVFVDCKIEGRYLVSNVAAQSAAQEAGFQNGDVLLAVNDVDLGEAVDERTDYEFSLNEEKLETANLSESLMEDSDLRGAFGAVSAEIFQQAGAEGLETVEIQVSRIDPAVERAKKVDLVVALPTTEKPLGLSTKFEAGCMRTTTGKKAIQWGRTEYETLAGEKRYKEAIVSRVPWSETRGFKIIAKDPDFINSFKNTIHFSVISVLLELVVGLIIALVVNSKFSGRGLMRAAMLIPWAIPTVVSAALWKIMFASNSSGIINKVLMDLGIIERPRLWVESLDLNTWMNSIIAVDVWKTSPFMALIILAGLQTIPSDVYEAADVDGAGKLRQFFQITLPLLRPTLAVALIFRTLDALRVFDVFSVMLDQNRLSMATYSHKVMIADKELGYSSAIGVLIFIFIFMFSMLYMKFVGIETND